jgi:hypothetical protein
VSDAIILLLTESKFAAFTEAQALEQKLAKEGSGRRWRAGSMGCVLRNDERKQRNLEILSDLVKPCSE